MAEYSSGPLGARNAGSGSPGGALRSRGSSPARRRGSCAALGPFSPRLGGGVATAGGARFFFDPTFDDEPRHFLDACFLCRKPLARHRDIYMYRGDTPFCSEECRQQQIEMDEAREKRWSLSMTAAGASRKEQQKQKEKAPPPQGIQVRAAGAVLAV